MRALSRLWVLGLWLVCGCNDGTSSVAADADGDAPHAAADADVDATHLAADADVDAKPPECQPEVSAEDCARCGPYPDDTLPGGFPISYCPDGSSLSCITCPTPDGCALACSDHACWDCLQSGEWQRPVLDCFCPTPDAGPG